MESLSNVVCGRPDAFNFEDSFGLGSDTEEETPTEEVQSSRKRRQIDGEKWPAYQVEEMSKLSSKLLSNPFFLNEI